MTKQLAPIEELADKFSCEKFNHAFKGEFSYEFTEPQLEQLRQAIIKDFVSTLEPVAWATKASITNAISGNDVIVGKKVKQGRTIEVLRDIAIYDLSEWKDK